MDFPFPFPNVPISPFAACPGPMMNPWMMMPAAGAAFGMMPTQEQREEMSIAFLTQQKDQIAQTRKYFMECLKSLDASVEAIDKELEKIGAARTQRQPGAKSK